MWDIMETLAPIIIKNVPGDIIEIGSGKSTYILAKIAESCGVKLHSCDLQVTKRLFDSHYIFVGSSFLFMENYHDRPAVVFLDGCHDYDVVKKEFDYFSALLLPGGVIFLHDTLPPSLRHLDRDQCSDAYRLRHDIEKDSHFNCFTWPYTADRCGLTMVSRSPYCIVDEVKL